MTFGDRNMYARKQLKWWPNDLDKKIGTSAPIAIGRYEREEIKPVADMAAKQANAQGKTLDYLLGKSEKMIPDQKNLLRLEDIEQLPEEDKYNISYTLDNLSKVAKLINIAAL